MPEDPPFTVYREQLTSLHHGLALWIPHPPEAIGDPPKAIYDKVSIGDVGYIQEGVFIRMFNVMLPWDHESNRILGEPMHYEPLSCGSFANILQFPFDKGEYCSRNVSPETNASNRQAMGPDDAEGFTYKCRSRGAFLSLPHGGHRKDIIRKKAFEDYIRDHVVSWFIWAQDNQLGVERIEELILVSGCTLTTSWAVVAFVDNTMAAEISLASRTLNDNGGARFIWNNMRGPVRYNNSRFEPRNPPTTPDQCVFIRGFRAKRILFWTRPIQAAAEPPPDDPDNRRDDEIQVSEVLGIPKYRDPLIGVLDYIVEKSLEDTIAEDTIAIAHNDDLQLIKDVETLTADAIEKFLREKQMPLRVKNGAAMLCDSILRDSRKPKDPFTVFPREVSLKVLVYLNPTSLCRVAQVSRRWNSLADDNILWREICAQHIGTKCEKCGWGLPILKRRRSVMPHSVSSSPSPLVGAMSSSPIGKRKQEDSATATCPKRHCCEPSPSAAPSVHPSTSPLPVPIPATESIGSTPPHCPSPLSLPTLIRPWKDVYSEYFKIGHYWQRGRCSVQTLKGHTGSVMCMHFSETYSHLPFPVLITGSYDRTARIWNLETGEEIRCIKGHTRALCALQFDEVKLVTGSMDHTLRIWNWRTGDCISTLEGHTDGVICLNFDSTFLASGSIDTTVKVWIFRTRECFTLRGHRDRVNAVLLWDSASATSSVRDASLQQNITQGKFLFSASDDCTVRLWDLTHRTCVRQFSGHMGQVKSLKLLSLDLCNPTEDNSEDHRCNETEPQDLLVSGSLDNTIKLWDIESGKVERTLFGHLEGVWAVACDKMRVVSGSHDRTIKVWSRDEGRCVSTLVGHTGAVTSLALGENKIFSGSDDGDVRIWSFCE